MNQRHSSEGPNPGFASGSSFGTGHDQQPGGQAWGGHQGGQQSARDYSQGQQPGDDFRSQGQWGGQAGGQAPWGAQGGQMGGQAGSRAGTHLTRNAPYHDSGMGYGGSPSDHGSGAQSFGPRGQEGRSGSLEPSEWAGAGPWGQAGHSWGGFQGSGHPDLNRRAGGQPGGFSPEYQGAGQQGGYPASAWPGQLAGSSFGAHPGSPIGGSSSGFQGGGHGAWQRNEASEHQDLLDPDYQQWRSEQMRSFDEDYRNWRQERFRRFSDDFSNWRKQRSGSGSGSGSGSEPGAGAGEDRPAVLVAGPGSRAGVSPQDGEPTERGDTTAHSTDMGSKPAGSGSGKTK